MYSEKAIQYFYDWEIRGRGYSLHPYNVSIEPLFAPFYYFSFDNRNFDDGKAPSFLERMFGKKKEAQVENLVEEKHSKPYRYNIQLKRINISYSSLTKINENLLLEFIDMLSESYERISFELIAKQNYFNIQIVCSNNDERRIENLLKTYFPSFVITIDDILDLPFEDYNHLLIVDFGYNEEFIRPISLGVNAQTGIMSVMNNLRNGETVMLQAIFEGVHHSWADSILRSVSFGGEPFFSDSPEMILCAKEKTSTPLLGAVIRIAVESNTLRDAESLILELIQNIQSSTKSNYNSLIPLSNDGYQYIDHLENLKFRATNRHGMIMNTKELCNFVNFPQTNLLINNDRKTKGISNALRDNKYILGINYHYGAVENVTLNDEQRLRHCHIIGATGTGKSTLITNLFLEDVFHGNGCIIFDPHGDTIDDIIIRIPENRLNDVILIDPSDYEYSFKINLLSAKSEVEKMVLSSDLVESFKRHSTSWGDQMTSVLSNAIIAFLESSKGGTLLDLRRFLLENNFRKEFLKTINDKSIHYYWNNEYTLLKKGSISPLLTRLDTFLRPKLIRNMLSDNTGLDFNEVLFKKKIVLVKLSQGLIGEENSYLLGSLILSKIYQVAQARQSIPNNERYPFYVYLDEFQHFITPSINSILSGARKYGLGLILAHQELNQIKDTDVLNSVLSNPNIRVCFRLGDNDSRKLESSFSYFESKDLQNLDIGDAIAKVGRSIEDFSLDTLPLSDNISNLNHQIIVENTRTHYSKKVSEIETVENDFSDNVDDKTEKYSDLVNEIIQTKQEKEEILNVVETVEESNINTKAKEYLENYTEKEEIREHRYLQTLIKKLAQQRGFKAVIEQEVDGGRVDVSLFKDELSIACEIALHNSAQYEVKNIEKCLRASYSHICVISKDEKHLRRIKSKTDEMIGVEKVKWLNLENLVEFLDSLVVNEKSSIEKRLRGYRVKVNYGVKD